jgi:uncharacterized membrane protein
VGARQLHVCARCTGLLVGVVVSPLLVLWNAQSALPAFLMALAILTADGMTQLRGWRSSTNALRFSSGLATGLLFVPALVQSIRGCVR